MCRAAEQEIAQVQVDIEKLRREKDEAEASYV